MFVLDQANEMSLATATVCQQKEAESLMLQKKMMGLGPLTNLQHVHHETSSRKSHTRNVNV